MSKEITKDDLIQAVVDQIKEDIHCGEYEALEEMLEFCSTESLIAYLPEGIWKRFKHLIEPIKEIRTENALTNLIKQFPNDQELGKQIRMRYGRIT